MLIDRAVTLYQEFLADVSQGHPARTSDWQRFASTVRQSVHSLDPNARHTMAGLVANVVSHGEAMLRLQAVSDSEISSLGSKLQAMMVATPEDTTSFTKKRPLRPTQSGSDSYRVKRVRSELDYRGQEGLQDTLDPVRQFFLHNISNPYPTASEKDTLCRQANITRKKLESDLTNWRRRSEWTDIMNTYCHGNRELMGRLINDIEGGKVNVGEEIRERYDRMKGYLEKRDEQAGEWVFQIEEMVRNGEIGMDRAHVVELDEVEEGLSEADAEGESDNESAPSAADEIVCAPLKSAFQLIPMSSPSSDKSSSPLSAVISHTQLLPPTTFSQVSYAKAPSTKSSYSSLSAASGMAAAHSRSTSGSNSLRSVSSSSSTSIAAIDPRLRHLKRPAPAESNVRSSRSRVEEILTEEPASWVENHDPSQTFHIGSDPAQAGSLDLTPYLMNPGDGVTFDASIWSTDSTFAYLPHIAQPADGSFELPPTYEFTFTQEPVSTSSQ